MFVCIETTEPPAGMLTESVTVSPSSAAFSSSSGKVNGFWWCVQFHDFCGVVRFGVGCGCFFFRWPVQARFKFPASRPSCSRVARYTNDEFSSWRVGINLLCCCCYCSCRYCVTADVKQRHWRSYYVDRDDPSTHSGQVDILVLTRVLGTWG